MLKKTALHSFHVGQNARMVDFAGWEMPLLYTGIVEEHRHTREVASLFDVSHMGRLEIRGADAASFLERICTRKLSSAEPGQSRYSHVCNESGGILDDVIVSRYEDHWLIVCNASNREKIVAWLESHRQGSDVTLKDTTEDTVMVALQGPTVIEKLQEKLSLPIADLKRYRFLTGSYMMMIQYTLFRSGYTGEDGVELIAPAMVASMLAPFLTEIKKETEGPKPAGLGARDTLRMEAGMPLYGHELHENIDPLSAGQDWCVSLDKDFIGADALRRIAEEGPRRKLIGLNVDGRRIGRQGTVVLDGERAIGEVTSGTQSPTLNRSIAMAYVDAEYTKPGTAVALKLGRSGVDAEVTPLPFYKRPTQ